MANTGRKIYQFLKQIDPLTGLPTGVRKPNSPLDKNYVQPVVDYETCPITAWKPVDEYCIIDSVCPTGWVLNADGTACQRLDEQPAIPPQGSGGTRGVVAKYNDVQWNNGGAVIFAPGYPQSGDGTVVSTLTTPHFWVNGNSQWDSVGRNTTDGRMNVTGIWSSPFAPDKEWIGFSRKITTQAAKTVYIGMAADDMFKFSLNGTVLVQALNLQGGPNFNFWNIYPVHLQAGDNYIEMYGLNAGGPAGFGVEIYDNSLSEIQAATHEGDLTIIFSTKDLVGQPFDIGQTYGWSCAPGWFLTTENGGYVCKKVVSQPPLVRNTGMKAYTNRQRLTNGTWDGFIEGNNEHIGIGPYFPPVQDLISCPI